MLDSLHNAGQAGSDRIIYAGGPSLLFRKRTRRRLESNDRCLDQLRSARDGLKERGRAALNDRDLGDGRRRVLLADFPIVGWGVGVATNALDVYSQVSGTGNPGHGGG